MNVSDYRRRLAANSVCESNLDRIFGAWLRARREGKGVEVKDLCRVTQIQPSRLRAIESGRVVIPVRELELCALADALGFSRDRAAAIVCGHVEPRQEQVRVNQG